jgi:hypothetical protein
MTRIRKAYRKRKRYRDSYYRCSCTVCSCYGIALQRGTICWRCAFVCYP